MKLISNIETWGDSHHPKLLDFIRILLGIFLMLKGAAFFHNMPFLRDIIVETRSINASADTVEYMLYYITFAHLAGGALIFLGLVTRLAALIQLPIVFGAVFFVNVLKSTVNSELWLSIIVLALLVLFILIGSGPLSLDRVLSIDRNKDDAV